MKESLAFEYRLEDDVAVKMLNRGMRDGRSKDDIESMDCAAWWDALLPRFRFGKGNSFCRRHPAEPSIPYKNKTENKFAAMTAAGLADLARRF